VAHAHTVGSHTGVWRLVCLVALSAMDYGR